MSKLNEFINATNSNKSLTLFINIILFVVLLVAGIVSFAMYIGLNRNEQWYFIVPLIIALVAGYLLFKRT